VAIEVTDRAAVAVVPSAGSGLLLVTIEEAARLLSLGRTTIYGLLSAGELRAVRVGRCRRISVSELADYVRRMEAKPEQSAGQRDVSPQKRGQG
jgi:excisionase family DNA binding protein